MALKFLNNATFAGTVSTGGDLTIGGTGGVFIPEYIYHVGDTNSYFGFSGADTYIVSTGGSTALTINSSQNATFAGDVSLADNKKLTFGAAPEIVTGKHGTGS